MTCMMSSQLGWTGLGLVVMIVVSSSASGMLGTEAAIPQRVLVELSQRHHLWGVLRLAIRRRRRRRHPPAAAVRADAGRAKRAPCWRDVYWGVNLDYGRAGMSPQKPGPTERSHTRSATGITYTLP